MHGRFAVLVILGLALVGPLAVAASSDSKSPSVAGPALTATPEKITNGDDPITITWSGIPKVR